MARIAITSANHSITRSLIEIFVSLPYEIIEQHELIILTRNMTPAPHLIPRNLRNKLSQEVLNKVRIRLVDYFSVENLERSFRVALTDVDRLIIIPINYPNPDSPAVLSRANSDEESDTLIEELTSHQGANGVVSNANNVFNDGAFINPINSSISIDSEEDPIKLLSLRSTQPRKRRVATYESRQLIQSEIESAILRVCSKSASIKHIIYISSIAAEHGQRLTQVVQCREAFCAQTEKLLQYMFGPVESGESSSASATNDSGQLTRRKKVRLTMSQQLNNAPGGSDHLNAPDSACNSPDVNNADVAVGNNCVLPLPNTAHVAAKKFYTILRLGVLTQNVMSWINPSVKTGTCIRLPAYENIKNSQFVTVDARDVALGVANIIFLTSINKSESSVANQILNMASEEWSFQGLAQLYSQIIKSPIPIYVHPPSEMIGMKEEEINALKTIALGRLSMGTEGMDDSANLLGGKRSKSFESALKTYAHKYL